MMDCTSDTMYLVSVIQFVVKVMAVIVSFVFKDAKQRGGSCARWLASLGFLSAKVSTFLELELFEFSSSLFQQQDLQLKSSTA